MPTVVVNGVAMEAQIGERLIDVARRNGAHVGFVCNGAGICQTCQCQVVAGAEHLSPVNVFDQAWLPERRLEEGHRLACKTTLSGAGTVELSTKVEDLRRQVLAVINPPADSNSVAQLGPLGQSIARMVSDEVSRFPLNAINALSQVKPSDFTWPFRDLNRYLSDVSRVISTTRGGNPSRQALSASAQASEKD
jgi:ferredoxin